MVEDGQRDQNGVRKIHQVGQTVYAFAGSYALFGPMIEWHVKFIQSRHDTGEYIPMPPLVGNDSHHSILWVFDLNGLTEFRTEVPYPVKLSLPNALGTGCEYAIGAMAAGTSAEEAVRIAARYDTNTGGEVITLPYPVNVPEQRPVQAAGV